MEYRHKSYVNYGFTIIELLVVIAIIGILAAITLVSYSGITNRAIGASLQSDLSNVSQKIKMYYSLYGAYPVIDSTNLCPTSPTIDSAYCIKASSGNTYDFHSGDLQTFCITAQNGTISYKILNDGVPVVGDCLSYKLAGYWPFDGTGSVANGQTIGFQDSSGNGNNGTAINPNGTGMAFATGKVGNTLSFDGVDGGVNIGNAASLNVAASDHTIEFWAIINNLSSTQGILGANTAGAQSGDYQVWIYNNSMVYFRGNGSIFEPANMTPAPPTGSWIHCAIVISGSSAQWYLNGEKRGSATTLNLTPTAVSQTRIIGALTTSLYPNSGSVDNFRIYSRALSAGEIGAIYNATK